MKPNRSSQIETGISLVKLGKELTRRTIVSRGLRIVLVTAAFAPLAYRLYQDWPEFQQAIGETRWVDIGIAIVPLVPIMLLLPYVPWLSLRIFGASVRFSLVTSTYFITQIAKYLPGGIWAIPGRMLAYRAIGVRRAQSVVSVIREMTVYFFGAVVVGILGLVIGMPFSNTILYAIGLGVVASILGVIAMTRPFFWRFLQSLRFLTKDPSRSQIEVPKSYLSLGWLPRMIIVSLAFWLFLGLPFRLLVLSISPGASTISWLEASSIFAIAWSAGFVVVFVPAGLGVRETVLAFLLARHLPVGEALSIALLGRLWWIAAEIFWVALSLIWISRNAEPVFRSIRLSRESTNDSRSKQIEPSSSDRESA